MPSIFYILKIDIITDLEKFLQFRILKRIHIEGHVVSQSV